MSLELFDWLVLDEWALAILLAVGIVLGLLVRAAFGRTGDQSEYVRTTWAHGSTQSSREDGDRYADQELHNDRCGGPVRR